MRDMPPTRDPLRPTAGFYLLRLTKGGWAVPCEIRRSGNLFVIEIDGVQQAGIWTMLAIEVVLRDWLTLGTSHPVASLLMYGMPTDEVTYRYRTALREWAREHKPDHPSLHPEKPIDPRLIPADEF